MTYQLTEALYRYHVSRTAVGPVTTTFRAGERVVLLGCNGSGKSTLLLLLAALLNATSGEISFDGAPISRAILDTNKEHRRQFRTRVGILFQDAESQLFCPTVFDEIAFGLNQKFPLDEARHRTDAVLTDFDLTHVASASPIALSGGEKKRVAIAAVLAMEPDVLLLDEPSAHLDAAALDDLLDRIEGYGASRHRIVIAATHDLALAPILGTRCVILGANHTVLHDGPTCSALANKELLHEARVLSRRIL